MLLLGGGASGGQARPGARLSRHPRGTRRRRFTIAIAADGRDKGIVSGSDNDSADGLDAIVKLAMHPDGKGLSADDFSAPRDNLSEDEQSAPDHLKKYLRVQVEVLGEIVAVFSGEGNRTIGTGKYRDTSADFVLACGKDIG